MKINALLAYFFASNFSELILREKNQSGEGRDGIFGTAKIKRHVYPSSNARSVSNVATRIRTGVATATTWSTNHYTMATSSSQRVYRHRAMRTSELCRCSIPVQCMSVT